MPSPWLTLAVAVDMAVMAVMEVDMQPMEGGMEGMEGDMPPIEEDAAMEGDMQPIEEAAVGRDMGRDLAVMEGNTRRMEVITINSATIE